MGVWIKDYTPKTISGFVGHERELKLLRELVSNYRKGSKAIFLYGGTGNGKTAAVYALANDLNYELVELNASDTRKKDEVISLLGGVIGQTSLFGTSKIVLIDEIDGLSGTKDRGAIPAVAEIIEKSKYPVVIVGDNAYDQKFKALRKISEFIEFKSPSTEQIVSVLKNICEKEKVSYDEAALKQLARISGGDVRAAINDLQTISVSGDKITKELVDEAGDRNTTKTMQDALTRVFKSSSAEISLGAFDDVEEDLDKIFLWVEENIPREYLEHKHLRDAFDNLSLADVFYGRIRRWQYYRFYVYCYGLMTAGISVVKEKKYESKPEYKETSRLLKIWMANQRNAKRKSIAQKIAAKTHTSSNEAFHSTVPYLQVIFRKNKETGMKMVKEFDLSSEEVDWLKGK
mgnify:CR=1 FL=1